MVFSHFFDRGNTPMHYVSICPFSNQKLMVMTMIMVHFLSSFIDSLLNSVSQRRYFHSIKVLTKFVMDDKPHLTCFFSQPKASLTSLSRNSLAVRNYGWKQQSKRSTESL